MVVAGRKITSNMAESIFRLISSRRNIPRLIRQFLSHRVTTIPCSSVLSSRRHFCTNKTHFGFEEVESVEKGERVYEVFKNVADTYDLLNDLMSCGVHRLWKDHFIYRLNPGPGMKLLDVAGGTGDIAFRFLRFVESKQNGNLSGFNSSSSSSSTSGSSDSHITSDSSSTDDIIRSRHVCDDRAHVTVCDINDNMIRVGRERAKQQDLSEGISWLVGDGEDLPIDDNSVDCYTIAYGIRNFTHIDKALSEAYRVLVPGGRFMCLEFSHVQNSLIGALYDWHSFENIPVIGKVVAGDWHSYQYLVESIRQFPNQEEFSRLIQNAGFRFVTYENLSFGITAIHSAFKL